MLVCLRRSFLAASLTLIVVTADIRLRHQTRVTLPINKGSGIEFVDFSSMYAKCAQV